MKYVSFEWKYSEIEERVFIPGYLREIYLFLLLKKAHFCDKIYFLFDMGPGESWSRWVSKFIASFSVIILRDTFVSFIASWLATKKRNLIVVS